MPTAAVIGCGDVSSVHFEAIAANPKIDLVAVCDTDPGRLAAAVAAFDVAGFADHQQLIEEMRPDVVHNARRITNTSPSPLTASRTGSTSS